VLAILEEEASRETDVDSLRKASLLWECKISHEIEKEAENQELEIR
jgi:hypothetical protein